MIPEYVTDNALDTSIRSAIEEDIREGDHSSLATIPADVKDTALLISKSEGIIAGIRVAERIYETFDNQIRIRIEKKDGERIFPDDVIFQVEGPTRHLLSSERLVLNYMQRMSGIATYTRKLKQCIEGTEAILLDTRKTTPNMRLFEKWAVVIGGGQNHRFGLFDMIMLKDNHIDFSGGISNAVNRAVKYLHNNLLDLKIEVETRTLKEVEEAVQTGKVDVIMLDNMDLVTMKKAVQLIDKRCKTEASGNITEHNIRDVAETGVDFISIGALTHSVNSLDLSFKAKKVKK